MGKYDREQGIIKGTWKQVKEYTGWEYALLRFLGVVVYALQIYQSPRREAYNIHVMTIYVERTKSVEAYPLAKVGA